MEAGAPGGGQSSPAVVDGRFIVDPPDCGRDAVCGVGHVVGDVGVVGVVAAAGEAVQAGDGRGGRVGVVHHGVVEGGGEFEHGLGGDEAARVDLGAQDFGAAGDVAVGAGVADEGGNFHSEGGGAEVKAGAVRRGRFRRGRRPGR
ncbi:hypothetical protein ABZ488_33090 [Streptomyces griseus]|uniref:hypothetical protein n=1 Tax=Streptomyces griseus TaxID=1911 RepID=UPI0033D592D6